ncbi:MAG: hypothetical protein IJF07_09795 [Lachnospiraceae bacterium]|nr:hypothetical protein [Lachnospiraceae bacterium]
MTFTPGGALIPFDPVEADYALGEKLDILLLDHIIIGDNRYTSFRELAYI